MEPWKVDIIDFIADNSENSKTSINEITIPKRRGPVINLNNGRAQTNLTNIIIKGHINHGAPQGGAIRAINMIHLMYFQDILLEGNEAEFGGEIFIVNMSDVIISNVSFLNNRVQHGGRLYTKSCQTFKMSNMTFKYNIAHNTGGGAHFEDMEEDMEKFGFY